MYAIVDIAGQQFKVEKDNDIFVHRLEGEAGDAVDFEKVMLIEDGENISVGKPFVEGAKISAKIVEHLKSDKVIVFHKKRRKGYQKQNGHRQYMSKIHIDGINVGA
nr:50S ribosomal protein L21 [Bacteroidota bacterium]